MDLVPYEAQAHKGLGPTWGLEHIWDLGLFARLQKFDGSLLLMPSFTLCRPCGTEPAGLCGVS